jgi:hypothetical protein
MSPYFCHIVVTTFIVVVGKVGGGECVARKLNGNFCTYSSKIQSSHLEQNPTVETRIMSYRRLYCCGLDIIGNKTSVDMNNITSSIVLLAIIHFYRHQYDNKTINDMILFISAIFEVDMDRIHNNRSADMMFFILAIVLFVDTVCINNKTIAIRCPIWFNVLAVGLLLLAVDAVRNHKNPNADTIGVPAYCTGTYVLYFHRKLYQDTKNCSPGQAEYDQSYCCYYYSIML